MEARLEQRRLDAGEATTQVLGGGEGEAQDEVGVVGLLALGAEQRVLRAWWCGGVAREGEVLCQQGDDVRRRLRGGFVAEGAGFDFGED